MNNELKKHYEDLFKQHGDSSHAVQYSDAASQFKRFEILSQVSNNINSVIDAGCGLGHFYEYLQSKEFKGRYHGVDFVEDFIKTATEKFKDNKDVSFGVFDLLKDQFPKGYEYVILSGVFNNKMPNNEEFMLRSIDKMFEACTKGIAFNSMSTYVDYQDENLFYTDPREIFDYCKKNLSRKVVLRHEYLVRENTIPFEYTMYIYK